MGVNEHGAASTHLFEPHTLGSAAGANGLACCCATPPRCFAGVEKFEPEPEAMPALAVVLVLLVKEEKEEERDDTKADSACCPATFALCFASFSSVLFFSLSGRE